eukprot:scaffold12130_cov18-Prasinocladus_malaysianus.AAC.1
MIAFRVVPGESKDDIKQQTAMALLSIRSIICNEMLGKQKQASALTNSASYSHALLICDSHIMCPQHCRLTAFHSNDPLACTYTVCRGDGFPGRPHLIER